MGIGNGRNAGYLATHILALGDDGIHSKVVRVERAETQADYDDTLAAARKRLAELKAKEAVSQLSSPSYTDSQACPT